MMTGPAAFGCQLLLQKLLLLVAGHWHCRYYYQEQHGEDTALGMWYP